MRRLESEADSATDAEAKQTLGAKARALADKYLEDEEVLSSANGLLQKLNLPGVTGTGNGKEATSAATLSFAAAPTIDEAPAQRTPILPAQSAVSAAPENPHSASIPAKPAPSPVKVPVSPQKKVQRASTQPVRIPNTKVLIGAGAAVALILLVTFTLLRRSHEPPTPPPAEPVAAVQPAPTPVASAVPSLPTMKLSSDTSAGRVTYDDQPSADLQDSQWTLDKISPGDHTFKFESSAGSLEVGLTAAAGTLPTIKTPVTAKGVLGVIVSGLVDHLHVYSSDTTARLSLDGQPPAQFQPEGIDLPSVAAGAHELTVSRGGEEYKLSVDLTAAPALDAFIESGQNVGTLVVVTGQDKSKVFLNGKALDQQTQGGQLRIANLEPREYVVRVAKSGYQDVAEQKIRIRKGQQGRLVFALLPVPHLASLSIQGGPPGAAVFVDQTNAGTVQPDGTLNVATIPPGDHVIELRKDRFKPKQFKKHFVVGTPVTLTAADTVLEAAPGELKITYTPADAQVTVTKAGESPTKVNSGGALILSAGAYTLSARMADGFTRTSTLDVTGGQSRSLDLSLAPTGMSMWDDPNGWKPDNGAFVRKGGDYILYGASPTSGTFIFSAMLTKGHRLQWVLNYTDPNNYDLFQIDENNFYRTDVRNGQKVSDAKVPHKGDKKSFRTLQIHVSPTEVVHSIKQGNVWFVLDRWSQPGTNLSAGKFGFYLPGGDQVSIANFSHYADLNLH